MIREGQENLPLMNRMNSLRVFMQKERTHQKRISAAAAEEYVCAPSLEITFKLG